MPSTIDSVASVAPAAQRDAGGGALQASESRYRRLFEAAQDGILLINAETAQIEDANPYLIEMLGYSHAEMLGRKLWEVGAFADVDKSADMFARLQATGYVRYADLPLKTKLGALISVEFISNAYDCEGVRVIQCNVRNITEQRAAEEQVRKLSLVVEQMPVSVVIANPAADIEYVNEALLQHSGYRRDEIVGQSMRMLLSSARDAPGAAEQHHALVQGQPWKGDVVGRRKDGSEFTGYTIVAPIRRADGTTSHSVTVTEDVTQRRRDADELERHRQHLEELVATRTRELADAKQAADAANVAKSAFLSNMSHEIRTPLGAIIGLAYLIRRSQVTPQQADWLTKLELAGQHLLELINAILELSRIDAGKLVLEESAVRVEAIAANVVSLLFEAAKAKHVHLAVEVQAVPGGLVGDAPRLQQALLNYVNNAVKFTEAGDITVRVTCPEQTADHALLRFEVHDTGIGIAADMLPRLFSAFEQGDSSTSRRFGGTGLGLTIVRELARHMGGDAGATSRLGVGSTFWFTARLRKNHHAQVDLSAAAGSARSRLARDFPSARILLVDDERTNREVTLEVLGTAALHVDVAASGHQAILLAAQRSYDVILMDLQMPAMDGLEATRRIRMLPGGAGSAIVALTANAFTTDKARCLEAGMDVFLTKPFDADVLFETLARALARRRDALAGAASAAAPAGGHPSFEPPP